MRRGARLELAVLLLLCAGCATLGHWLGRGRDAAALRQARAAAAVDSLALATARAELARRGTAAARAETVLVARRVVVDRMLADSVPTLAPLVTAIRAERLAADSAVSSWRSVAVACDSVVAGEADRRARAIALAVLATRDTLRQERRRRRWAEAGQWVAWGVAAAVVVR